MSYNVRMRGNGDFTEEELINKIKTQLQLFRTEKPYINTYNVFIPCIIGEYYSEQKKDTKKALEYYIKSIEAYRNNTEPYPDEEIKNVKTTYYNVCYNIGEIYYLKDVIENPDTKEGEHPVVDAHQENANYIKAIEYLKEAADDGKLLDACFYLGSIYMVLKNGAESVRYLKRAANRGHMYSQTKLASFYEIGRFVNRNLDKALYWYERAARQGDMTALARLIDLWQ